MYSFTWSHVIQSSVGDDGEGVYSEAACLRPSEEAVIIQSYRQIQVDRVGTADE